MDELEVETAAGPTLSQRPELNRFNTAGATCWQTACERRAPST